MPAPPIDIAVIGAGAAGLMAGISAARAAPGRKVVILDGARTLGAKILVAGGGRCNVTHHSVDESAYAGSSRNAIKNDAARLGANAVLIQQQQYSQHELSGGTANATLIGKAYKCGE